MDTTAPEFELEPELDMGDYEIGRCRTCKWWEKADRWCNLPDEELSKETDMGLFGDPEEEIRNLARSVVHNYISMHELERHTHSQTMRDIVDAIAEAHKQNAIKIDALATALGYEFEDVQPGVVANKKVK